MLSRARRFEFGRRSIPASAAAPDPTAEVDRKAC
jgi:hypothetical protein